MAKRGEFTPAIADKMEGFLGRPSSRAELRLMPYLQSVMVNMQVIDPSKVNQEEREVLAKLRDEKHIEGGVSGLAVTRDYWNFLHKILWFAYVAHGDQP